MKDTYTLTVDLLADSIADAVAIDVENRVHYVELSRFNSDLPSDEKERALVLKSLVNAVKRNIASADVYLTKDEDGADILYVEEL